MKKKTYLALTMFLGILLSFILHALLEIVFIKFAQSRNMPINGHTVANLGWCALPIWLNLGLWILGILGGYFLGQYWWRLVYIEKRHWRFNKK